MEENLALNKPASQSGTYLTFVASRAVDGIAGIASLAAEKKLSMIGGQSTSN